MRFALNGQGEKIEVEFSGQRATCSCCDHEVVGRHGKIRPKHWYHKSLKECDLWHEPITAWHLEWKNYFQKKNLEVELKDSQNKTSHRADIRLDNGLVIEVQNSPIKIEEIEQREKFYGNEKGLIWILNGKTLLKKCELSYTYEEKQH